MEPRAAFTVRGADSDMDPVLILVVDDNPGNALLVERGLRDVAVQNEVLRFASGGAVLEYLFRTGAGAHREEGRELVMLLDLHMPKVDGFEVLRRMQDHSELVRIPVIMLTSAEDQGSIERCVALGCTQYIAKPFDPVMFLRVVGECGLGLSIMGGGG
jgi:CheY-like chemotaxis protein